MGGKPHSSLRYLHAQGEYLMSGSLILLLILLGVLTIGIWLYSGGDDW